jgi:hypothetical protein
MSGKSLGEHTGDVLLPYFLALRKVPVAPLANSIRKLREKVQEAKEER